MSKTKKKNKQLVQLIVLALVLVVLVGALFLGKYLNTQAELAEEEAASVTISVPYLDDVTTVVLNDGENSETYIYDSENECWLWAEDTSFPLNSNYLNSMLNTWSALSPSTELEALDSLSAYGLDPAQCSATIYNDDGESMTILVGIASGSYYYAMIEGESTIYLVTSTMNSYLNYGLYDMARKTTIPTVTSDTLVSLAIYCEALDEDSILLEQELTETTTTDDDGEDVTETVSTWYCGNEDITEADNLSELTSEIVGLSFDELYNYAADDQLLAECGLDDPQCTVVVTYSSSETDDDGNTTTEIAEFTLAIGDMTEDGSYYYIRLLDSTAGNIEVYLIDFSDLSTLMTVCEGGVDALYSTEAE